MSAKDVAEIDEQCTHCNRVIFLVAYRWSKGDRIETEELGTPLGPIHTTSANPPVRVGTVKLCSACDGEAVQSAVNRK